MVPLVLAHPLAPVLLDTTKSSAEIDKKSLVADSPFIISNNFFYYNNNSKQKFKTKNFLPQQLLFLANAVSFGSISVAFLFYTLFRDKGR